MYKIWFEFCICRLKIITQGDRDGKNSNIVYSFNEYFNNWALCMKMIIIGSPPSSQRSYKLAYEKTQQANTHTITSAAYRVGCLSLFVPISKLLFLFLFLWVLRFVNTRNKKTLKSDWQLKLRKKRDNGGRR